MRLALLVSFLSGCGGKTSEPAPQPALLGTYTRASIEHLSKSCRGAVSWSGESSFTCLTGEKPLRYYMVDFDASGVITGISFAVLDQHEIVETFERTFTPIVDPSVRDVLRASITNLGPSLTILAPQLAGRSYAWKGPDGSERRSLSWSYRPLSPAPP